MLVRFSTAAGVSRRACPVLLDHQCFWWVLPGKPCCRCFWWLMSALWWVLPIYVLLRASLVGSARFSLLPYFVGTSSLLPESLVCVGLVQFSSAATISLVLVGFVVRFANLCFLFAVSCGFSAAPLSTLQNAWLFSVVSSFFAHECSLSALRFVGCLRTSIDKNRHDRNLGILPKYGGERPVLQTSDGLRCS